MRQLNKRQKKLIKEWVDENLKKDFLNLIDMPTELYEELERINDHETLYQNAERHIDDLILERAYGKNK
jgi:hypothetical protein